MNDSQPGDISQRLAAALAYRYRIERELGQGGMATVYLARDLKHDLAEATGYTVAAVRRAADDLAAARLIESRDEQPAEYRVTYDAWAPLLGLRDRPPRWANWHQRFQFATAFLHWADTARERPLSAYAFGAHGRDLLARHRPAFERDRVAVWSAHAPVQDWGAFVSRSVRSMAAWMEEMA